MIKLEKLQNIFKKLVSFPKNKLEKLTKQLGISAKINWK